MLRSRPARRRIAQRHERRSPQISGDGGAGPALPPLDESDTTPLQVDPSVAKNAAPVPPVAPVPGIGNATLVPLPPTAPGASSSETPSATSSPTAEQVEIPTSLSTIIPATCAVIGVIVFAFVLWNLWLRKQKRKAKKAVIALYAPSPNYDETLKHSTKHLLEPVTPVSPSGQFGLPSSPKDVRPMNAKFPSSRSSTPREKYAFDMPSPPPPATPATPKRFSIFGQVRAMPEFKDRDAKPVRSYSTRSASLLSSRMSTRRKPKQADTLAMPDLPALRITDCDSPVETSLPLPGLAGKLVSVVQAFDSTMPDELPVAVGETLRVLEVYDDDWCLAERIGRKKGRGILPQGCVSEKQLVEPQKRFSMLMLK